MRPRYLSILSGLLSLAGCASPNSPIRTDAGNLTQAHVDVIIARCGGFSGMVTIEKNELVIYPAKDISVTGCVLDALRATGETSLPVIGNQRFETPAEK